MWFLVTWTTYGYWLPGDPRGFRSRGHKKHVSPPARYANGEDVYNAADYERLFKSMKKQVPNAVELGVGHIEQVMQIIEHTVSSLIKRPSIMAVGKHHAHVLIEPINVLVSDFCKSAKGRSATALRKSSLPGMKWARGYHAKPIKTDEDARNAWRYISSHKNKGCKVKRIDPKK